MGKRLGWTKLHRARQRAMLIRGGWGSAYGARVLRRRLKTLFV
jgi:hypothetical protein